MEARAEHLTLRDAARRLGVHENTVRNWVAAGRLHPIIFPGSNRRKFDAAEVDRVAQEQRGSVSPIQDRRRAVGRDLVDATLLDAWADRLIARGLFPRLVRALLAASSDVRGLSVRAGEGIAVPGWDGRVDSATGSPWVPEGASVWELGAGNDPAKKAQTEFRKRTRDPDGVDPATTTFVFATPRRWRGARRWEQRRREEGVWKDVRVLDADDLEGWLDTAPTIRAWISEQIGLRPQDVVTTSEWWRRFAGRTRPALPKGLLLAGRSAERERLREAVTSGASVIGVQASSRDEAIAFLAVGLAEADPPAVVVSSSDAWSRVVSARHVTVLVPAFEGADVAAAQEAGHVVVVPLGAEDVATRSTIKLPLPSRLEARQALEDADPSMPFDRADRMAALARRSLSSLLRTIAIDPRAARPPWAARPHDAMLAPLMLVGSWTAAEEDQAAVTRVVGTNWMEIERELAGWLTTGDPPFVKAGDEWRLASPIEAFSLFEPALTAADLQGWREATLEVLGELDPRLELPPDERPFAALRGRRVRFSDSLREGLAQGLALLGSFGDRPYDGLVPGHELAASIVRELLGRANADASCILWASLSPQLPMLAEAAPQTFIDAVDAGLSGAEPPLAAIFQDAETDPWLSGSAPHTGLLWALEKLCWSPDHLTDAALALARLATLDPGGHLANRPAASLRTVFMPWAPRTSATVAMRLEAIDALRRGYPDVAWRLLMALMPRAHDTSLSTSRPVFRDWLPDREGVTVTAWREAIAGLVKRAVEDAGQRPERWTEFVEHLAALPEEERSPVLDGLQTIEPATLEVSARVLLWRRLNDEVARHRSHADARWALDEASLERLEAAAARVEPAWAPERHASLFDWHPHLPGIPPRDHATYGRVLEARRGAAVREALEIAGLDGVLRLAEESTLPGRVGLSLAGVAGHEVGDAVLGGLGAPGKRGQLAAGWVASMAQREGDSWVEDATHRVARMAQDAQVAFLLALPPRRRTWELAQGFDDDVTAAYWAAVQPWAESATDLTYLVKRLLDHDRPWAAIRALAMGCAGGGEPRPPTDLVERVLRAAPSVEATHDLHAVGAYEIGVLLDYLVATGADQRTLADLEWVYFPALEDTRVPSALYAVLADDPAFFVDLVSRVYRGRSERRRRLDEHETALVERAWQVLADWRTPPGQQEGGTIEAEILQAWVRRARMLLAEADRSDVGDEQIGQLLSGSLPGADGAWPAEPVRDLIETIGSTDLETGIFIGRVNSRGVTARGPYDGGDQERALAATYRGWARQVKPRWPRTARILRQLADSYERDARREDAEAERHANAG